MVRYISDYIRYIFKTDTVVSTVREELQLCQTYLKMQQMRFPDCIDCRCRIDIEQRLLAHRIPFMTIPTFVENIMKHAFDMYRENIIWIQVLSEGEDLKIVVDDNGKGFSEEILPELNNLNVLKESSHFGLRNIQRRLDLLYNGKGKLSFCNHRDEDGKILGARVTMILPLQTKREVPHESADC